LLYVCIVLFLLFVWFFDLLLCSLLVVNASCCYLRILICHQLANACRISMDCQLCDDLFRI
jgi:hypothetical protein